MLFPTVAFALFFCFAFLANWLLRPRPTPWRLSMVSLSLYFYGFWDRRFVLLLVLSIGLNYAVGKAVFKRRVDGVPTRRGRHILRAGIATNLCILGFFKYYGFFTTSASNSLGRLGIEVSPPVLDLTLPIGISFFTFQAISYIVDVGRDDRTPTSLARLSRLPLVLPPAGCRTDRAGFGHGPSDRPPP